MHQAELLAADIADALDLLPDIILADRFDDLVERVEQAFRLQRRAGDRLAVRQFRRRSGGERRHDLAFQVGPGEPLGVDLDARVLGLEAAGDVVERLDGLWLGLGVPDAHDLVLRQAPERRTRRSVRSRARSSATCAWLSSRERLFTFNRGVVARPRASSVRVPRGGLAAMPTAAGVFGRMPHHGIKGWKSCQSTRRHGRCRNAL